MKSLLLKDYYCIRHQLFLMLGAILFFASIFMLMGGGMYVSGEEKPLGIFFYQLTDYASVFCFSSVLLNVLAIDTDSGWSYFAHTTPLTEKQLIGSKLAGMLSLVGFMVTLMTILNLFAALIFGMPLWLMLTIPFCCGCAQTVVLAPFCTLAAHMDGKYRSVLYYSYALIVTALFVSLFLLPDTSFPATVLLTMCVLPIAAFLVCYASFRAGHKVNGRQ